MGAETGSREDLWQHQFSAVDSEIVKMASLCGVDMLDRAQLERVLDNDASVCARSNELAFEKPHTLLMAHYLLRDRAAGLIGEQAAQAAIDQVVTGPVRKFAVLRSGGPK